MPRVPAQGRYHLRTVSVPGGSLAVGDWLPVSRRGEPPTLERRVTTPVRPGRDPTVVALHGLTGNHRCWSYVVDELPQARVLAPDLRGRGGSCALRGPCGMTAHADDVLRVLDAQHVDRAALLGHSMGGFVALVTADRHPDRVTSLTLVDGGLPMTRKVPRDPAAVSREVASTIMARLDLVFPTRASAIQFWRRHPAFEHKWSSVLEDYALYDLGGEAPHLRSRTNKKSVAEDSESILTGQEHRDALDRLRHPTQLLVAPKGLSNEYPGLYPPQYLLYWMEKYPQIEIRPLQSVNHYTILISRAGGRLVAAAIRRGLDGGIHGPIV